MPIIESTLEFYEEIRKLSNDELREKTVQFKKRISDHISGKEKEIEELRGQLNSEEIGIDEKEKLYTTLDKLEKESYELTQESSTRSFPKPLR